MPLSSFLPTIFDHIHRQLPFRVSPNSSYAPLGGSIKPYVISRDLTISSVLRGFSPCPPPALRAPQGQQTPSPQFCLTLNHYTVNMAPQVSQDSFIEEEDDTWYVSLFKLRPLTLLQDSTDHVLTSPLCVEEFDLSDKNFRPCPCGYQVRAPFSILLGLVILIINSHPRSASSALITSRTT